MTTNVNPTVAWVCGTAIILGVIGAIVALAWHGTLAGAAVVAILTAIVGIAGGIIGVHAGVKASNNAATGQLLLMRESLTRPPA